ncbi:MAG: polyketide synthase, partial [Leptolyngbyaceae cyanobacterium SM1_3_5]|nr:polyketide synthase [Leptolyngbyaceae cyanobacterium SM1_3_5]
SLLEVSWEALENAGMVPAIGSRAGVFIGISSNDYSQQLFTRDISAIDAYLATGNSHSTAAGRLSYSLGFTGASVAIDTACSSSLVAVHLACQSLRNQECEFAIAGGVNRIISPEFSINFSQARMLAADGRCKTFDASADGFGRAEGCGVIVLKRLADAIADQDNILAVICGSAINQDGRSSGLTVPNGPAQVQVIRQALQNAGLDPAEVGYLEAHGTGTALGDPIELNAIGSVFANSHSIDRPLQIGSVKTNLGHLEAAAGIAGLIKVVLALQHQEIPPHLHLQTPTPHVDWDRLPLNVATRRTPQPLQVAGVSSFGFSGTNAHVVLGAYQAEPASIESVLSEISAADRPLHLLTLSAKTPAALRELTDRYAEHLAAHPDRPLADVCFSANTGRSQFAHRLCCIASSTEDCRSQLAAFAKGDAIANIFISDNLAEADGWRSIWVNVAEKYLRGEAIDWAQFEQTVRRRVTLPTYPFQQQRYWFDRSAKKAIRSWGKSSIWRDLLPFISRIESANSLPPFLPNIKFQVR